jgi:hypothetical protein
MVGKQLRAELRWRWGGRAIRHRYDTGTTWELVIDTSNDYVGGHSGFCVDFSVFDSGFLRRLS